MSKRKWFVILVVFVAIVSPCYAEDLYLNSACSSGCDGTTVEKGWAAPADIQWASSYDSGTATAGGGGGAWGF